MAETGKGIKKELATPGAVPGDDDVEKLMKRRKAFNKRVKESGLSGWQGKKKKKAPAKAVAATKQKKEGLSWKDILMPWTIGD